MINPDIFREYDIRGVAEKDLTSSVVTALGAGFAAYLKPKRINAVTIGYDARISSKRLCDDLCLGLTTSGINVILLGLCPTPTLYFSLYHAKPGAGVMITGSHNPPEFNGFKLCVGKETIYGAEIQKLRKTINEETPVESSRTGTVSHLPMLPIYIDHLKKMFSPCEGPKLKVVLDAGNGTAGLAAPQIIRSMDCEVIELFSEPDGNFPNHHPDPTIPENLASLTHAVRNNRADMGIAFDGDADRIGVVDESGNILWGDQLMIIFSRDILREKPGSTFISEVKCSQVMYDDIRAHGGKAVMWKTGHSLIKAKMKEVSAALAGEMSGHMFFADRYFGYDDAIYAACRLIEVLKRVKSSEGNQTSLGDLVADLPRVYNTPEIRFDCPDNLKFKVVEKIKEIFSRDSDLNPKLREVVTVDGVRAIFDKGWGLIRASNTQPVLVMRFEASDPTALESIKSLMEENVKGVIRGL